MTPTAAFCIIDSKSILVGNIHMEEWKKISDIMALTKNYLNQAQTRRHEPQIPEKITAAPLNQPPLVPNPC